jgi:hypothetical protein
VFKSSSETVPVPTALNVSGVGSKPLSTMLSITQSFVATFIS